MLHEAIGEVGKEKSFEELHRFRGFQKIKKDFRRFYRDNGLNLVITQKEYGYFFFKCKKFCKLKEKSDFK